MQLSLKAYYKRDFLNDLTIFEIDGFYDSNLKTFISTINKKNEEAFEKNKEDPKKSKKNEKDSKIIIDVDDLIEQAKKFISSFKIIENKEIIDFCKKYKTIDWSDKYRKKISDKIYFDIAFKFPISLEIFHSMLPNILEIDESNIAFGDFEEYDKLVSEYLKSNLLREYDIILGENAVLLDNNKYLVKRISDISYIVDFDSLKYFFLKKDKRLKENLNILWKGTPYFMYGKYWISKNSTHCFSPCFYKEATHILIDCNKDCIIQNPLFSQYLEKTDNLLSIIPINQKNTYSEEDI